jgi:hypothetical protein
MDNVLRKTIRDEVEAALAKRKRQDNDNNDQCSSTDDSKFPKKGKKTEQRLTNLLGKIRSSNSKSKQKSGKKKKVQMRYERYCFEEEKFLIVKAKNGGGTRFLEVDFPDDVNFVDIKWQSVGLYFDNNLHNGFNESSADCLFKLTSQSGEDIDVEENLWDYLNRKGLNVSKTVFTLQSTHSAPLKNDSSLLEDDFIISIFQAKVA